MSATGIIGTFGKAPASGYRIFAPLSQRREICVLPASQEEVPAVSASRMMPSRSNVAGNRAGDSPDDASAVQTYRFCNLRGIDGSASKRVDEDVGRTARARSAREGAGVLARRRSGRRMSAVPPEPDPPVKEPAFLRGGA